MRIIIVEDHILYRQIIQKCCVETGNTVVSCLESGRTAIELCLEERPDCAIIDLRLKEGSGGLILDCLERSGWLPKILLISGCLAPYVVYRLDRLAVPSGFLHKEAAKVDDIKAAIEVIAQGKRSLCPAYLEMKRRMRRGQMSFVGILTGRQLELLQYIAIDADDRTIAEGMRVAVRTIEGHRSNLMRKLGIENSVRLGTYAREMGFDLFPPEGLVVETAEDAAARFRFGAESRLRPNK